MADAITIKALQDASLDAKSLEEVVNGNESKQVTTRKGETYPSVKKAIKTLFENGGLPAVPFKTKALMTASALVDGKYAMVTDDTVNNGLYVKTAGAWVKSEYDLNAAASNAVNKKIPQIRQTEETIFGVSDSLGRLSLEVASDGKVTASSIQANEVNLKNPKSKITSGILDALSVADGAGKTALAVKVDGSTEIARLVSNNILFKEQDLGDYIDSVVKQSSELGVTDNKGGGFPANINHLEIFGQSLSQGAYSLPIQTTVQKYDSLMFSGGIRSKHPTYTVPNFYADFIPLVEGAAADGYVGYETPCGGASDAVKQLILNEDGIAYTEQEYQILCTASGEGGTGINTLSTTYLNGHLKPAITNAYNLSQSKGKTYAMPYIGWVQGENDNSISGGLSISAYKTALSNLTDSIDNHLKTLNPDLGLKGMIMGQLCSFTSVSRETPHIELAIYEAATQPGSRFYLACPFYIFDYEDRYHVDGVSSKWMGAYIGLVYKRLVVDGIDWKHLQPISHTKQGRVLEVKYHVPVQPLVVDTTQVALNENYGFTLVDASGASINLSSVTITQGDTIRFLADTVIPDGSELRYAYTPNTPTPSTGVGRLTGARGNIRDSQGNDIVFDSSGINKPMHNWLPIHYYKV